MPFQYIAIEGPIGVGKTSLAERLATSLDAVTILEETENPFLADFYAGRPGSALQAQLFYLLNRHRQQLSIRQGDLFTQSTVSDYLFDKDKIFAYLNLDDNELFIYQRLYDLLMKDVSAPDLVITFRLRPTSSRGGCAIVRREPMASRSNRATSTSASSTRHTSISSFTTQRHRSSSSKRHSWIWREATMPLTI